MMTSSFRISNGHVMHTGVALTTARIASHATDGKKLPSVSLKLSGRSGKQSCYSPIRKQTNTTSPHTEKHENIITFDFGIDYGIHDVSTFDECLVYPHPAVFDTEAFYTSQEVEGAIAAILDGRYDASGVESLCINTVDNDSKRPLTPKRNAKRSAKVKRRLDSDMAIFSNLSDAVKPGTITFKTVQNVPNISTATRVTICPFNGRMARMGMSAFEVACGAFARSEKEIKRIR
tara:strand:+ start:236 stop:934 length:699 start_codon:yes stop_codon:yes gene_type:complete